MSIELKVKQLVEEFYDEIVEIRRDIHMHPELSEQEERTMNLISEKLIRFMVRSSCSDRKNAP